jgi:hypothetical protein
MKNESLNDCLEKVRIATKLVHTLSLAQLRRVENAFRVKAKRKKLELQK